MLTLIFHRSQFDHSGRRVVVSDGPNETVIERIKKQADLTEIDPETFDEIRRANRRGLDIHGIINPFEHEMSQGDPDGVARVLIVDRDWDKLRDRYLSLREEV